jgi:Tfp pilus assembly major pilin PilA
MANRMFYEFVQNLIPKMTVLTGTISIGGTGAPTIATGQFAGVASIARTGTGAYTLTLSDAYQADVCVLLSARNSTAGLGTVQVKAVDLSTAKTVTFFTLDSTFAAADFASGSIIDVLIIARDSTVVPK